MPSKSEGARRRRTIDFLQSQLLGLPNEEENHSPCNQIETRVETESTGRCHDGSHTGEGYTKDTGYIERWKCQLGLCAGGTAKTYQRSC